MMTIWRGLWASWGLACILAGADVSAADSVNSGDIMGDLPHAKHSPSSPRACVSAHDGESVSLECRLNESATGGVLAYGGGDVYLSKGSGRVTVPTAALREGPLTLFCATEDGSSWYNISLGEGMKELTACAHRQDPTNPIHPALWVWVVVICLAVGVLVVGYACWTNRAEMPSSGEQSGDGDEAARNATKATRDVFPNYSVPASLPVGTCPLADGRAPATSQAAVEEPPVVASPPAADKRASFVQRFAARSLKGLGWDDDRPYVNV